MMINYVLEALHNKGGQAIGRRSFFVLGHRILGIGTISDIFQMRGTVDESNDA